MTAAIDPTESIDESRFERLAQEALRNDVIAREAQAAGLDENYLFGQLNERRADLSQVPKSLIDQLHDKNAKRDEARASTDDYEGSRAALPGISIFALASTFTVVNMLVTAPTHATTLGKLSAFCHQHPWGTWIVFGILYLIWVSLFSSIIRGRATYRQRSSELPQFRQEAIDADKAIDDTVLQQLIVPELYTRINAAKTSFDVILGHCESSGLSQVFNPRYEINNDAKVRLNRLLDAMPGGSIGIAGPRGAGKTTLLTSLTGNRTLLLKDKPTVSVTVSAPVQYDPRDFILHLYGSLCRATIARERPPKPDTPESQFRSALRNVGVPVVRVAVAVAGTIHGVSDLASVAGTLARVIVGSSWYSRIVSGLGVLIILFGFNLLDLKVNHMRWQQAQKAKPTAVAPKSENQWVVADALGISPGGVILIGIVLLITGAAWAVYDDRTRPVSDPGSPDETALERSARERLEEIRFQQSYSSGWSGTLTLPIGLQGGINAATNLARKQQSLPELVDDFRLFARSVTISYQILIGIDELDKIEDDEAAQRFLNEIKSIFGIDWCFYLISVSESAMSAFERRGIPFRDAFDSSLDAIVYVDYLNLENASALLRRRVIGLPAPFLWLIYSMSGGLARDLIRNCRDLLDVRDEDDVDSIADIARGLIVRDYASKARAMITKAGDLQIEPESTQAIRAMSATSLATIDAAALTAIANGLFEAGRALVDMDGDATRIVRRRKLADLTVEFAVYVYYLATVLEIFTARVPGIAQQHNEYPTLFDDLCAIRKRMASNTSSALVLLDEFRRASQMSVPDFGRSAAADQDALAKAVKRMRARFRAAQPPTSAATGP